MSDPQTQDTPPAPGPAPTAPDMRAAGPTGAPGDMPAPAPSPYLDAENARAEANGEPGVAPIYPISPADVRNDAIRGAWRSRRVMPTLPELKAPGIPGSPGPRGASDDPVADLRMYPQTINNEYLTPMSAVIEQAISSGDPAALEQYASGIAQEIAVGLVKKAYAALESAPRATTVTGAVTTDSSPADGATANVATFTVLDQNGQPMAAPLTVSCDKATATPNPASGTTAADGTLAVDVIDSVAETVVVTATSGSVSGTASLTFAEVAPPEALRDREDDSDGGRNG